jgi:chemotaxis response regulator CheB
MHRRTRLPCVFGSSARGRIDSYYLLVVDEKCLAELSFVRFWKQQAEWVVVGEAFNGRHAIETVDEYLRPLTVIDFVMPEMDGMEAARQLIRRNTAIVIRL